MITIGILTGLYLSGAIDGYAWSFGVVVASITFLALM